MKSKYYFFRFQLLPVLDDEKQEVLEFEETERKKIVKNKNNTLHTILSQLSNNESESRFKYNRMIEQIPPNCFLIKIGRKKTVPIEYKDFTKTEAESWPSIRLFIDNDPAIQLIAIEENIDAFPSYKTPLKIIKEAIREQLKKAKLEMYISQLFYPSSFWELVEQSGKNIAAVKFNLITPNMSNISATLTSDIKSMAKDADAHITKIELSAHRDQHLKLIDNETVRGIVEYAAAGGGKTSVRLRGLKKYQTGGNDPLEYIIEDIQIEGWKGGELQDIIGLLIDRRA